MQLWQKQSVRCDREPGRSGKTVAAKETVFSNQKKPFLFLHFVRKKCRTSGYDLHTEKLTIMKDVKQ